MVAECLLLLARLPSSARANYSQVKRSRPITKAIVEDLGDTDNSPSDQIETDEEELKG